MGCDPQNTALLNEIQKLFSTANGLFIEPNYIDIALLVLSYLKQGAVVEQIEQFPTVYFIKVDCYVF